DGDLGPVRRRLHAAVVGGRGAVLAAAVERGDFVALDGVERLVRVETAVARVRQRGVGAATAVGEDRGAAALHGVFLLVAVLGLLLRELGLRADVDPPAGQARGEARVLTFAADRQRQLVVG